MITDSVVQPLAGSNPFFASHFFAYQYLLQAHLQKRMMIISSLELRATYFLENCSVIYVRILGIINLNPTKNQMFSTNNIIVEG